jgi:hypothetical protein
VTVAPPMTFRFTNAGVAIREEAEMLKC